jgi:outer membrane protein OmpA-like peptidoglycan-associated protein
MPVRPLIDKPRAAPSRRDWLMAAAAAPWLALWAPSVRAAQGVKVYGSNTLPSPQEIADILANGARRSMKQRGVRMTPADKPAAPEPQHATDNIADASAFSLPVPFAFDSARLEAGARELLDVVAEGILLNNGAFAVVIEGHTDAHGPSSYNERLSLRRAEAVRQYLAEQHGVASGLLHVEGAGPRRPIRPDKPYAAENRRVQFRAA